MYAAETIRPTFAAAVAAFVVFRGASRSLLGMAWAGAEITEAEALATVRLVWRRAVGVVVKTSPVAGKADRVAVDIVALF